MIALGLWNALVCIALGEDLAGTIFTLVDDDAVNLGVPLSAESGRLEATGFSSTHDRSLMRREPDSNTSGASLLAVGGHADGEIDAAGEIDEEVTGQLNSSEQTAGSPLENWRPHGDPTWQISGWSAQPDMWEPLGCFAKLQSDDSTPGKVIGVRDDACKYYRRDHGDVCRSGLPFFRFRSNDMSPGVCKDYCLGKGLDLCGLVGGGPNAECRCGATGRISWLFGNRPPPKYLRFQSEDSRLPDGSNVCEVVAFKYIGEFIQGAIPPKLQMQTALDRAFIQSIACPDNDCAVAEDDDHHVTHQRAVH